MLERAPSFSLLTLGHLLWSWRPSSPALSSKQRGNQQGWCKSVSCGGVPMHQQVRAVWSQGACRGMSFQQCGKQLTAFLTQEPSSCPDCAQGNLSSWLGVDDAGLVPLLVLVKKQLPLLDESFAHHILASREDPFLPPFGAFSNGRKAMHLMKCWKQLREWISLQAFGEESGRPTGSHWHS